MDYFSANFGTVFKLYKIGGQFSERTLKITKATGGRALQAIKSEAVKVGLDIVPENAERPSQQQNEYDFRHNIEYRLKHDCCFTLAEFGNFLQALEKRAFKG